MKDADAALFHYSKAPLLSVHSVAQRDEPDAKPSGLWLSVAGEDDWKSWCQGEQWGLSRLVYETRLCLSPEARVLWLRGPASLDAFDAEYGADRYRRCVDWSRVANRYQGIIIAPYVRERRFDGRASDWYYSWDCASGCIWDADAIASLNSAPAQPKEPDNG
jgi:hypothetical protein